tara:strand:+ start:473 stop:799 length:327 start_codon:yes stop_codon:yes gene_type:complete
MTSTMTTKYATEVIDNLMSGHGPDSGSRHAYAYDLEVALPAIKNWLIEKMNDNYLRWSAGIISADVYQDIMIKYSDLSTMIIDELKQESTEEREVREYDEDSQKGVLF